SCVQSQLIASVTLTEERRAGNWHSSEGTSTLIIRALIISVAPSVPPASAHLSCLSVPVSAAYQCPSVMPVNAHYCHLPVPPHQCHLSVPISAAYQCPSVQPH
ncbi:unnamed protein product, partial [Staurois parvus]